MKMIICAAIFAATTIAVYYNKAIIKKISDITAKYKSDINNFIKTSLIRVGKGEIFRIEAVLVAATAALFLITMKASVLILGAAAAIAAPKIYVNLKQKKYIDEYYNQLPDFIESIL